MRFGVRESAVLTVICALSNAVALAGLGALFGYPRLLDAPADVTLATAQDRMGALGVFTGIAALGAVLLLPVTLGLVDAARPGRPDGATAADRAAVSTQPRGLLQALPGVGGLLATAAAAGCAATASWAYWFVKVPALGTGQTRGEQAGAAAAAFDALRLGLGTFVGEILTPVLLAAWTIHVARLTTACMPLPDRPRRLRGAPRRGSRSRTGRPQAGGARRERVPDIPDGGAVGRLVPRRSDDVLIEPVAPPPAGAWARLAGLGCRWARPLLGGSAAVCAVLLVLGTAGWAGAPVDRGVGILGRMLWSIWLVGVAVAMWASTAPGAVAPAGRRRGLVRGEPGSWNGSPQAGGPGAARGEGQQPVPGRRAGAGYARFGAAPFRYLAYLAREGRFAGSASPGRAGPHQAGGPGSAALAGPGHDDTTQPGEDAIIEMVRVPPARTPGDGSGGAAEGRDEGRERGRPVADGDDEPTEPSAPSPSGCPAP